jgi:hypothetical protein
VQTADGNKGWIAEFLVWGEQKYYGEMVLNIVPINC